MPTRVSVYTCVCVCVCVVEPCCMYAPSLTAVKAFGLTLTLAW